MNSDKIYIIYENEDSKLHEQWKGPRRLETLKQQQFGNGAELKTKVNWDYLDGNLTCFLVEPFLVHIEPVWVVCPGICFAGPWPYAGDQSLVSIVGLTVIVLSLPNSADIDSQRCVRSWSKLKSTFDSIISIDATISNRKHQCLTWSMILIISMISKSRIRAVCTR